MITNITRRAVVRALAAISATGGAGAAMAVAEAPAAEVAVERVRRLADELSLAMDDWMEDISYPGARWPVWQAHVYPASYHQYPVMFENVNSRRELTPEQRYEAARLEFIAATKAMHPDITDWRTCASDDDDVPPGRVQGMFMILEHPSKAVLA